MKNKYLILIILLLIIIDGAYILSPFSPLNKTTLNGETISLSSGYTVENSTTKSMILNNGTNTIKIYVKNYTEDLEARVIEYQENIKNYTVTYEKLDIPDQEIYKTTAISTKGNYSLTGYWFEKHGDIYNIQTSDNQTETENVIFNIINSMN